jgi:hypothetical protein
MAIAAVSRLIIKEWPEPSGKIERFYKASLYWLEELF